MRFIQKFSHVLLAGSVLLFAAGEVMADVCDVSDRLEAKGKVLPGNLGVSKRERAFIEGFGLPLRKGLFGSVYVREGELMDWFATNGCDEDLVAWALKKGRAEKQEQSDGGASSGGASSGGASSGGRGDAGL